MGSDQPKEEAQVQVGAHALPLPSSECMDVSPSPLTPSILDPYHTMLWFSANISDLLDCMLLESRSHKVSIVIQAPLSVPDT